MRRKGEEEETPWASFADALAGMLFVFILTTVLFVVKAMEAEKAAKKAEEAAEAQRQALSGAKETARDLVLKENQEYGQLTKCLRDASIPDGKLKLEVVPERSDARVSMFLREVADVNGQSTPAAWFKTCEATLGERTAALEAVRACIGEVATSDAIASRYDMRVYLEGHTDAEGVRPTGDCKSTSQTPCSFPSNWELSAARAAAVLREVTTPKEQSATTAGVTRLVDAGRLRLLAVGMADTAPAWKRLCEQSRAENRKPSTDDQVVCGALEESARTGRASNLRALLQTTNCVKKFKLAGCEGSGTSALLCKWANGCGEDEKEYDWRRDLLRRVDLRIELEVREATTKAEVAAAEEAP